MLKKFEGRSLHEVIDDLHQFHADVVKIRVIHEDVEGGSIPLNDGVLLFEKAKELLTSVAKSTFNKRKYFSGGVSQDVTDFINTLRLGQTEVGSYVVNLIIPVDQIQSDQADLDSVSLTRTVTQTLARSLTAIDESIVEYKNTNSELSFDPAVNKGVSANLCDALIGLTGEAMSRNVNIKISLSKSDNELHDIQLEHTFSSNSVPYLQHASEYYKGKYMIPNYVLTGHVTSLKHEDDDVFGTVIVTSMVNGKEKGVTFELPIDEYWQAHHAHKAMQTVECSGDLYVSPRSTNLIDPKGFRVFGSDDMFDDEP